MSSTLAAPVTLTSAIGPKRANRRSIIAAWRRMRRQQQRQAARYGDTAAEKQSRKEFLRQSRAAQRSLIASRKGRRIDLLALLHLRRADGKPVWALRDPTLATYSWISAIEIGCNGVYRAARDHKFTPLVSGWHIVGCANRRGQRRCEIVPVDLGDKDLYPSGIPPLPDKARAIVTDPKVRRKATWIGLLYQSESWQEARPDPAIVVEWRDRPGEYYVLCVWGADQPRIMEFVD